MLLCLLRAHNPHTYDTSRLKNTKNHILSAIVYNKQNPAGMGPLGISIFDKKMCIDAPSNGLFAGPGDVTYPPLNLRPGTL